MKVYKFELTVKEGYDEFWEEVNRSTAPEEEVLAMIKEGMYRGGMREGDDYDIKLVETE